MSTLTNIDQQKLPLSLPPGLLEALDLQYRTPPRAYHSAQHVLDVIRHFGDVAAGPGWKQPREVLLAVLFHDAVYEAGRKDNESKSAVLARAAIAQWLPGEAIDANRVAQLIEFTARHGSLGSEVLDADAAHFLDADMAILGSDAATFQAYDAAIAREYIHVPTILYRMGRKKFLGSLVKAERIFHSNFFHDRYDAQARQNLRRAVE